MKNILFILSVFLIVTACSTVKEGRVSKLEKKQERKLAEKELVKKAVESRMFVIKMSRLYTLRGLPITLIPKTNYIIINGERAQISLGYSGRQYSSRPISGINFRGETVRYNLKSNTTKGIYYINMEVKQGNYSFNLNLTIDDDGYCSASVTNPYIESTRYTGNLVPILKRNNIIPEKKDSSII
jgi:hypothetical protein